MKYLIIHLKKTLFRSLINPKQLFLLIAMSLTVINPAFALGRLFMTPEMRTQVEQQTSADLNQQNEPSEDNNFIRLNGFVKPKKGVSTIWVNGLNKNKVQHKNAHVQHWVSPKNQISVDLQGKNVQLSPGQILDIENRTVKESYDLNADLNTKSNKAEADLQNNQVQSSEPDSQTHSTVSDAKKMQQQISAIPVLDLNK